jgi:hypothetical protein
MALDREVYLLREPIFIDWTLTNVSDRTITVGKVNPLTQIHFEFTDAKGIKRPIHSGVCVLGKGPILVTLEPNQSLAGWIALCQDYPAVLGLGSFKMRAVCKVGYLKKDKDEAGSLDVKSKEIGFKVVKPDGAAGKIVDLIDRTMATGDEGDGIDVEEQNCKCRETKTAIRERNEVLCNSWFRNYALCERIMKESRSARFSAAAAFALGMWDWAKGSRGKAQPPNEVELKKACDRFTACEKSDGSSRYLKGLAAYHRLLAIMDGAGKNQQLEARKQAEKLIKDYAGSSMASEARAILKKLEASRKPDR